ncbi:MBL fold hydrolase [Deltaproteobacteria bacterium]|nr:MBL fold hydrolase [Deltaproteobacteria bacterium]
MGNVRLCIHRAADTIGGNCLEIVAPTGERLILDAGRPLATPDDEPTPTPPSLDITRPVMGVVLSHAHTDHCGLLSELPGSWPVYCGKATEQLVRLFAVLQRTTMAQTFHTWGESGQAFSLGSFTITPFIIDHSAFDAYALKIEVGGKTIMYSGDFRAHGRKIARTKALMQNPPPVVDALILEGTNLIAEGATSKPTPTESELEERFVSLFRETRGRVFVSWSSSNIDRTVTLFRACKKSGRILVLDLFCMLVLIRLKEFARLPQPDWSGGHMRAVVTSRMKQLTRRLGEDNLVERLIGVNAAMSARKLAQTPERWVIMARGSLVDEYAGQGVVPNADDAWIWSLWEGYLKMGSTQSMKDYFAPCRKICLHTSGHANQEMLVRFATAMRPKMLIPVHVEECRQFVKVFSDAIQLNNGQYLDI